VRKTLAQRKTKEVDLLLTFVIKQEAGGHTALCLEFDIASCGPTEEQAVDSLKRLIELYVADCLEEGRVSIPKRPVSSEALREFLAPPRVSSTLSLVSRREQVPVHVATADLA
jgi:predicted RNase H-like HicB family nuclease